MRLLNSTSFIMADQPLTVAKSVMAQGATPPCSARSHSMNVRSQTKGWICGIMTLKEVKIENITVTSRIISAAPARHSTVRKRSR